MEKPEKRSTAIVLAAGNGRRMNSPVAKQFLLLEDRPVLWYSLQAVEHSPIIDDCILVTGEDDIAHVREEIVDRYGFHKVDAVVAGGRERYESVYRALCVLAEGGLSVPNRDGYVFIHDGARPFLTERILQDTFDAVRAYHACVAAVPSKDTVKLADEEGFAVSTPARRLVWNIQTPQVFDTPLVLAAYFKFMEGLKAGSGQTVTDDASVVELYSDIKVKLVEASYENIKITTPEDLSFAESLLRRMEIYASALTHLHFAK
jgi:2-C-methyl-D-erythritol 4-phosphate cytidylyltransferase